MKNILALLLLTISSVAVASQCDDKFPNGKEIKVPNTTVLCNTFYATVFDEKNNAAVFSTEIAVDKKGKLERGNDFHSDSRLKNSPTPDDYTNSGYDRGHLTPAADAGTQEQMSDTFLMTNMTPQEPTVNRTPWRLMEVKVRDNGFKYVVTGAVYSFPAKTIGKRNVSVPVSYYKIVYGADGKIKAVYEADNKPNSQVVESKIEIVEKKSGIKFQ
jgi:endonuclease G